MSDVRGTLLERNLRFVQERRTCNSVKERAYTFVREQMELANTNLLAIELDPSCSGQAHSDYYSTIDLVLVMGMKARRLDVFSQYSVFHLQFVQ